MAKTLILLSIDPDETGLVVRVEVARRKPRIVNTTGQTVAETHGPGLAKCAAPVIQLRRAVGK